MSNERPSPPTAAEVELRKLLHEQNIKAAQHAHDKSDEFARQTNESKIWTDQPPYVIDGPTTNRWNILNRVFHFLSFIAGVSCLVLFIPCSLPNHLAPRPSGVFLVPKAF